MSKSINRIETAIAMVNLAQADVNSAENAAELRFAKRALKKAQQELINAKEAREAYLQSRRDRYVLRCEARAEAKASGLKGAAKNNKAKTLYKQRLEATKALRLS